MDERSVPPRISVIVPVYNREATILRAIASVLSQDYVDYEIVVVDDGSTDKTAEVLSSLNDSHIRVHHQNNRGRSAARNCGTKLATGEYVTFLDSDDEVLPGWLSELASLTADPDVAIASCGARLTDGSHGGMVRSYLPHQYGPSFYNVYGQFAPPGTFMVRSDVFAAVGGYAEELSQDENTELSMRLAKYCQDHGLSAVGVQKQLVLYHRDRTFNSGNCALFQDLVDSNEYMLTHHWEALQREPHRIRNCCVIAGVNSVRLGRYAAARSYFHMAMRYDPKNWRHYLRYASALVPAIGRAYWLRHQ